MNDYANKLRQLAKEPCFRNASLVEISVRSNELVYRFVQPESGVTATVTSAHISEFTTTDGSVFNLLKITPAELIINATVLGSRFSQDVILFETDKGVLKVTRTSGFEFATVLIKQNSSIREYWI